MNHLQALEDKRENLGDYILLILLANWLMNDQDMLIGGRGRVLEYFGQQVGQQMDLAAKITPEMRELAETFDGRPFNPSRGDRNRTE